MPDAQFHCQSFLQAKLPRCVAVTALGEVFNYLFDRSNTQSRLAGVFARVYPAAASRIVYLRRRHAWPRALGQQPQPLDQRRLGLPGQHSRGRGSKAAGGEITSFRRVGQAFRRDHELHRLRLFDRDAIAAALARVGFKVRAVRGYGAMRFPPGWVGFVARKPAE